MRATEGTFERHKVTQMIALVVSSAEDLPRSSFNSQLKLSYSNIGAQVERLGACIGAWRSGN